MGIADQRRRAVAAPGILAMAGGAGAVEIALGLRHLGGADAGPVLLGGDLENTERERRTAANKAKANFFTGFSTRRDALQSLG